MPMNNFKSSAKAKNKYRIITTDKTIQNYSISFINYTTFIGDMINLKNIIDAAEEHDLIKNLFYWWLNTVES